MTAPHDSIQQLRRPLLDAAREADTARGSNKTVMNRTLGRCADVLYTTADRLWTAASLAGIDVAGDLVLAEKLAAAQFEWNAGRQMEALDRLLEAVGHMSRQIPELNRKAGAA